MGAALVMPFHVSLLEIFIVFSSLGLVWPPLIFSSVFSKCLKYLPHPAHNQKLKQAMVSSLLPQPSGFASSYIS